MKVYIMTDLEGVAGVINWDDYGAPGARYYETARSLTTAETNAAIEGALAAGATEILVVDGHGHGAINPSELHPAARLFAGRPMNYPFMCDESFNAAMVIGQHAKSNTDGGHLSHTGSFLIEDLTINGISVGELGCNMLFCAYFGVPTIFVSGDLACCREAQMLVPEIETAAVKEGLKRGPATGLTGEQNKLHNGAAVHMHPQRAQELIRNKAEIGLRRVAEIRRFWIEPPYELISILRPTDTEPPKTARCEANDLLELLQMPRVYV
ncbi:MAG: M55 family metallopeptidase [Candidatus Zipacnadales bacterium]